MHQGGRLRGGSIGEPKEPPKPPGSNRITAKQKVLSATLNIKRVSHHPLDHPMPPCDVPFGLVTQQGKLSSFENPANSGSISWRMVVLPTPLAPVTRKEHRSTCAIGLQAWQR
jgi:hypothetical protein